MPAGSLEFNLYPKLTEAQIAAIGEVIVETGTAIERAIKDPDSPTAAPYRTGNLRRSYHTSKLRETVGELSVEVGNDMSVADYAVWLEFGTSKMAARPHLVPSTEAQRQRFEQRIDEIVLGGDAAFAYGNLVLAPASPEPEGFSFGLPDY